MINKPYISVGKTKMLHDNNMTNINIFPKKCL